MKYSQKSFTVAVSSSKVTQEAWDRTFGKKRRCPVCGQSVDTENPCDDACHAPFFKKKG